jgi:quinolinate synthase
MGRNLVTLFEGLASMDEASVRAVHAAHTPKTVGSLLERFHYFQQGVCIVHHMFGADVARRIREDYADAMVTAHLEVPGEMFELGAEAARRDAGVVGSTSNILDFIAKKVEEAVESGQKRRLRFVLGTEAGMITSIVRKVQAELRAHHERAAHEVEVEIIFPVASEAIAETTDAELAIVPGVASGEGCSVAGGCATCPYMKMNSLDATIDLLERVSAVPNAVLAPYHPKLYSERVDGRTTAEVGGESILHMRYFQKEGRLSDELVRDIETRNEEHARV